MVEECQEPCASVLADDSLSSLEERLDALQDRAIASLVQQGFQPSNVTSQRFMNLRYEGTDVPVMTMCPGDGDYAAAFEATYKVWVLYI